MLAIDHVILPVADLAREAEHLETRHGLTSVEGGRHPAWGTANWIVPLGACYLELVAVADNGTAARSDFGRWIAAATPGRLLSWAVRTDSIESVGRRLGRSVIPGSRILPTGALVTWRSVGLDVAVREPGIPFFIQWGDGVSPPGAFTVSRGDGQPTLKLLSVPAEPGRLAEWLGDHDLPIDVTGPSGRSTVTVRLGRTEFTLG